MPKYKYEWEDPEIIQINTTVPHTAASLSIPMERARSAAKSSPMGSLAQRGLAVPMGS